MNNIIYLIRKSIANSFTILNLFLGFSSIVFIALSFKSDASYYISYACNLIFIAAIIDAFDGKIARKLGTSNDFGREIDSLADLVSFCMVPSLLIFVHYMLVLPDLINLKILILLSSFPLIFGAVRLAKYNALREMRDSEEYLGLPTPANAIFICSTIMFTYNLPYRSIIELDSRIFNWLNDILSNFFINEYMI